MQASKIVFGIVVGFGAFACAGTTPPQAAGSCGADQYQGFVNGPSRAVTGLDIPGNSRHFGRTEPVATGDPSRLNFVHSGTAVEAVVNPASTVVRVFCG